MYFTNSTSLSGFEESGQQKERPRSFHFLLSLSWRLESCQVTTPSLWTLESCDANDWMPMAILLPKPLQLGIGISQSAGFVNYSQLLPIFLSIIRRHSIASLNYFRDQKDLEESVAWESVSVCKLWNSSACRWSVAKVNCCSAEE